MTKAYLHTYFHEAHNLTQVIYNYELRLQDDDDDDDQSGDRLKYANHYWIDCNNIL